MTDRDTSTGSAQVEVVRRMHAAYNGRDEQALLDCLAEDVRWHVAGDHPLAGTYEGREGVWEDHFQPLWPSPARVEEKQIVDHGDYAVAFLDEIHNFGEGDQAWRTVEVLRLDNGEITERRAFTSDQETLDAYLTRGCRAAGITAS